MVAIGDVDEANCAIGAAVAVLEPGEMAEALRRIQNDLFDLGADLATPLGDAALDAVALRVTAGQVARLEREIDRFNDSLAPLNSFILPGGSAAAAALHLARAVARRAERSTVAATHQVAIRPEVVSYLNRLSDWLFVAARAMNKCGADDVLWVPGASR